MQQCNFCLQLDPSFNPESIDIHYFKECPMLTLCWECHQVVEVKNMEEHLLEECEEMSKYKYHPKCKQILLVEEFENHVCDRP